MRGSAQKKIFLIFLQLLFLSCQSGPEKKMQSDWADVTLHAVGVGSIKGDGSTPERMQAVQEAKRDAYTGLESQIMALQTDSDKHVSELAAEDVEIHKKISAFVRGAKILSTENNNNRIEILTEIFLGENFKATIGLAKKKSRPMPSDNRQQEFPR
jgi:hypothetical protein